ncbi:MAG: DUF711 family protein [bacterium]|nr:DUF711 family protein [bacterium]
MKVRTVTFFYRFKNLFIDDGFLDFLSKAKMAESEFAKAGFAPQTVRVTTNISDFIKSEKDVKSALMLEDVCEDFGITFVNYGEFSSNSELLKSVLAKTRNVSASTKVLCSDEEMIRRAAYAVKEISSLGMNKNFNHCVSMNIAPHTPYYPASYATARGFSVGLENGDILQKSFASAKNLSSAGDALLGTLNKVYKRIEDVSKRASVKSKIDYLGTDTSFAPGLKKSESVMGAFEMLKEKTGADYLAIAGLITDAAKNVKVKRVGYCGLMLPVCEDLILAKLSDRNVMNIERILLLSSVCGCGLDTIPLSGSIKTERVFTILLDTATLSRKLSKPLSVRLLPMKGLKAKKKTNFCSQYLVDCKTME